MTMVGLFSKAACLSTYAWVHTHYRLVDLPWNSPWTWILTAVLVDLGYYWFHRASHEVGVLWAVHQVHHSSEEFNLTTAFHQPSLSRLLHHGRPGPLLSQVQADPVPAQQHEAVHEARQEGTQTPAEQSSPRHRGQGLRGE